MKDLKGILKALHRCILLITYISLWVSSAEALPALKDETFQYRLSWNGIRAGTAWLGILRDGDRIKIFSRVRSADFISLFYEVNDLAESYLEPAEGFYPGKPLQYRIKIKEGRHRRDKEVVFNERKVIYKDHLKKQQQEITVPEGIFDPLSAFFAIRFKDLEVGRSIFITVFDSKKVWNVEVQVLKKERIELPSGEVDTILIKPLMESEGIFYRKGDIYIWLTDDERRIPVMLKTKVLIGSVVATIE